MDENSYHEITRIEEYDCKMATCQWILQSVIILFF